jgi:signal transduction histidine kinase
LAENGHNPDDRAPRDVAKSLHTGSQRHDAPHGRRYTGVYTGFVLLAGIVTAFLLRAAILLTPVPYYGLGTYDNPLRSPVHGLVEAVDPSSPAGHAGMQVGDAVRSVRAVLLTTPLSTSGFASNEEALPNMAPPSLDALLYERSAGDGAEAGGGVTPGLALEVDVERPSPGGPGRALTFTLAPAVPPFEVQVGRFQPLGMALFFCVLGFVVWLLRPLKGAAQRFFWLSLLAALMLGAGSLSSFYMSLPFSAYLFRASLVAVAAVAFHFYATFPNPLPTSLRAVAVPLVYAVGGVVLIISVVLPYLSAASLFDLGPQSLGRAYAIVALVAALALVLRRDRLADREALLRQRFILVGMLLSLVPTVFFYFLPQLVLGEPLLPFLWTLPALLLLPASVAVAVWAGEMGRVDRLLNRSLVYVLLALLLLGGYLLIFWTLDRLQPGVLGQPLVAGLLALLTVALYAPLRRRIQKLVDRVFYGGWYNYGDLVREGSIGLSRAVDFPDMVGRLMGIVRTMRFKEAALLWPQEPLRGGLLLTATHEGSYIGYSRLLIEQWGLRRDGPFGQALRAHDGPHSADDLRRLMHSQRDALIEGANSLLATPSARWFLPLVSKGSLRAVLVLGERSGEEVLSPEDYDALVALAGQAALAAETVALLQTLRARLDEVVRVRDALAEAQKKLVRSKQGEQLRLARLLHDGAVQSLLRITYDLPAYSTEVSEANQVGAVGRQVGEVGQRPPDLQDPPYELGKRGEPDDLQERSRPSAARNAAELRSDVLAVVEQLRDLIGALRPAGLDDLGLEAALRGRIETLRREVAGRAVRWTQDGAASAPEFRLETTREFQRYGGLNLPYEVRLALFQVAGEALGNTVRHSHAGRVDVLLDVSEGEAILIVEDDGRGFQVPASLGGLALQRHYGLVGIAEAVEAQGGTLAVESEPGTGTTVIARIPLDAAARPEKGLDNESIENANEAEDPADAN